MSKQWRQRLTALVALTALFIGVGVAGAAWMGKGVGGGAGKGGAVKLDVYWELGDIEAFEADADTGWPGEFGDVVVRVRNETPKPVEILQLSAPAGATFSGHDGVCTRTGAMDPGVMGMPAVEVIDGWTHNAADLPGYTGPVGQWQEGESAQTSLGNVVVQPGEYGVYMVPDAYYMHEDAEDACQDQVFWIDEVTVTGTYGPR